MFDKYETVSKEKFEDDDDDANIPEDGDEHINSSLLDRPSS